MAFKHQPGPIIVETDVSNFRDLVQRLTGLHPANLPLAIQSCCSEEKTLHQPRNCSSSKKLRRRRPQQQESCESITNPKIIDSFSPRRGFHFPTEQHGQEGVPCPVISMYPDFPRAEHGMFDEMSDSLVGECVEAPEPELLALFPMYSSRMRV